MRREDRRAEDIEVMVTMSMLNREPDGKLYAAREPLIRKIVKLPQGLPHSEAGRRLLSAVGARGFEPDSWCGADWCWRNGEVGIHAGTLSTMSLSNVRG